MTAQQAPTRSPSWEGERATDRAFMRQAVALGERHLGLAAPNPSVGAVLVDESDGRMEILARAVTAPGGRPHAERQAIAKAGARASGATLFATLEPCSHHGRTPPCAEAIIEAGIRRVVYGIEDPDIRVAGKGLAMLRAAGIETIEGVLAAECRALALGHILRVTQGRPLVTLKLAITADGFVAHGDGRPLAITGGIANAQTHLLRARCDAVMVGIGTVLADDPRLDCRLPGLAARSPIRVVLDTLLRTPVAARIVTTARERPSLIIAGPDAPRAAEERLLAAGAEVIRVERGADGLIAIGAALRALAARGITRLLCESGPRLADALAREALADEIIVIRSAKALGEPGLAAFGPELAHLLSQQSLILAEEARFGEDRLTRYLKA